MKARHAYLTLIGEATMLNLVLENGDLLCVEISDAHLKNLLQDGIAIAFRPEGRL